MLDPTAPPSTQRFLNQNARIGTTRARGSAPRRVQPVVDRPCVSQASGHAVYQAQELPPDPAVGGQSLRCAG